MDKIKTIIFDLGGVLIDWNPSYVFDELITDPERRAYFFKYVATSDWNENQDAGYPIAQATAERIAMFPDFKAELTAYYGRWEEMLGGPIFPTVDILKDLIRQGRKPIYALTNWSAETFPVAQARYDFLGWFDGIVVSGIEKTRKPYDEIYLLTLERFDLEAESTIFIDDNKRNVEAAQRLGIQSIRFESPDQLRKDLIRLKVLE